MDPEVAGGIAVAAGLVASLIQYVGRHWRAFAKWSRVTAVVLSLIAGVAIAAIQEVDGSGETKDFFTLALIALGASQAFYGLVLSKMPITPTAKTRNASGQFTKKSE